jgi:hypothetical protein
MAELDPTGGTVQVGELGIRSPSLTGTVESLDSQVGPGTLRSTGGTSDAFQSALDRASMETTHVVTLEATELPGMSPGGAARAGGAEGPVIELDVPQAADGFEQAVLSVDERGVTTWSFAPPSEGGPGVRGAGVTRTFVIKRPAGGAAAPEGQPSRSIFGEAGKQVLKVVAFPLGQAIGRGLNSFLEQWEREHQGYGVRDYATADYTAAAPYFDDDPGRWQQLATGRTLLFVHGTFSRAHGAFNRLPADAMQALHEMYEGRVIAFDHQSISNDPIENIDWLVGRIPDGLSLDLDIICHSRGGLVSRALAERTDQLAGSRQIRVHRTALVGTVNNGTILADVSHWNDLVDTLSTVINTVGFVIGDTVDLILSFVRQLAVAAYPQLRGLACMVPSGDFLKTLNALPRGSNEYLAIASNYEPAAGELQAFFVNQVRDRIFSMKENDSMVRIDSVCGSDDATAGAFAPITEQLILDAREGVEHAGYFGHPAVADRLVTWLRAGLPTPV